MIAVWINQFYCYLLPYLLNYYLWHDITENNQTPCVIVKVIADYDYIYNVINYYYTGYVIGNYDYLIPCYQLQLLITSTLNATDVFV